jgi:hypothetical protein
MAAAVVQREAVDEDAPLSTCRCLGEIKLWSSRILPMVPPRLLWTPCLFAWRSNERSEAPRSSFSNRSRGRLN